MKSCLLVEGASCITLPSSRQVPIAPITVTLICLAFRTCSSGLPFLHQLFGFDYTEEYVVSSTQISWCGFDLIKLATSRLNAPLSSAIRSD